MKRERTIKNATQHALSELKGQRTSNEEMIAQFAAENALSTSVIPFGFFDDEPSSCPRREEDSPRNVGKNGEFGPTELR